MSAETIVQPLNELSLQEPSCQPKPLGRFEKQTFDVEERERAILEKEQENCRRAELIIQRREELNERYDLNEKMHEALQEKSAALNLEFDRFEGEGWIFNGKREKYAERFQRLQKESSVLVQTAIEKLKLTEKMVKSAVLLVSRDETLAQLHRRQAEISNEQAELVEQRVELDRESREIWLECLEVDKTTVELHWDYLSVVDQRDRLAVERDRFERRKKANE